jgi:hypothetical protein
MAFYTQHPTLSQKDTMMALKNEMETMFAEYHQPITEKEATTMLRILTKLVEEDYLQPNTYQMMCWWAVNAYKYEKKEVWWKTINANYTAYLDEFPFRDEWSCYEPKWNWWLTKDSDDE